MATILTRKTIKEVIYGNNTKNYIPCKFIIPSYQRGYRWKREQLRLLIEDIMDFRENKPPKGRNNEEDPFYCLQPLVVKPTTRNGEIWYEVIDGQQRLTSIFVILSAINQYYVEKAKKQLFPIEYITRDNSGIWSKKLGDADYMSANIDFYHINEAFNQAEESIEQFEDEITDAYSALASELLDNVQVIWYEINSSESPIDIFTRLNIGKIPLTNAELIKAMILQESNFGNQTSSNMQSQIALEWDAIERKLQRDDFWGFIYDRNNDLKYDTRIEYIFDLMKNKTKDHDKNYTFNAFYQEYKQHRLSDNVTIYIERLWEEIKQYFLTFEEWFEDKERNSLLYHYIGYLIENGYPINQLKDYQVQEGVKATKIEFIAHLKELIKSTILKGVDLDNVKYKNRRSVQRVLLLFNIQTIVNSKHADIRFPFHLYKNGSWDIEHIASQTDFIPDAKKIRKWAIDIFKYLTGIEYEDSDKTSLQIAKYFDEADETTESYEICKKLIEFLTKDIDQERQMRIFEDTMNYFQVDKSVGDKDDISNLALLDSVTNRSYGNAIFPVKRMRIIENDACGIFVPICTKNVFHKQYSRKLDDLMYWSEEDAKAYLNEIKTVLKDFLF
ncbi:MAG: DUF262 domain-containing protein [Bacteroidales bacterium]